MAIDRQAFFGAIRPLFGGRISQDQIRGLTAILDAWEAKMPTSDIRWLAYMLATAFHETARTMLPVREAFWLSEAWRKAHLRYYPYYGRGYVQLTWQANYAKAGDYVGADLVSSPDLALRPDYAAVVMQVGMTEGWFRRDHNGRPHTLGRYFSHGVSDAVGAREIINGPEWKTIAGQRVLVASVIARYHAAFAEALAGRVAPAMAAAFAEPEPADAGPAGLYQDAAADDWPMEASPDANLAVLAAAVSAAPEAPRSDLLALTASVVGSYVSNNALLPARLPALLRAVHSTLRELDGESPADGAISVDGVAEDGQLADLPAIEQPEAASAPGQKKAARSRDGSARKAASPG